MEIHKLNHRPEIEKNDKLKEAFQQLEKLLNLLRNKELPADIVASLNKEIEALNSNSSPADELRKTIKKKQAKIIELLEKEIKMVPRNYYRNIWLAVGMAAFGLPIGVVFGTSLGNMAYLGLGLPIGMIIGIGVGTAMDKKAYEKGRQLDID
jgi:F0F1-type ATP synthase assembly protein I